ncbi:MAG TPA: hypothetical protein VKB26_10555 [Candidatus Acidoferrales bacterium]|nr:hypothetical protein [Candidatus Acidoferrales bacterium]
MPQSKRAVHLSHVGPQALVLFLLLLPLSAAIQGCSARRTPAPATGQVIFAQKIPAPGIPDFGKVNDYLYRGAQPRDDGLDHLKLFGIDTIIDLRGELHGVIENERQRAQSLGMRFVNLPGNGWSPATDEEIAQFFALVRERPRRKIFIHCWLGGDRSGMFIAAYLSPLTGGRPTKRFRRCVPFTTWNSGTRA